jgi:hypothetical protein
MTKQRRKLPKAVRQRVAEQAGYRCSYCRSPEWAGVPMVIDHVTPLASGGSSAIENLCLACYRCNEFKGARLEVVDPLTGSSVTLFKPSIQSWRDHFAWSNDGLYVVGLTACGRATVETLHLNDDRLVQARRIWLLVGLHPPLE